MWLVVILCVLPFWIINDLLSGIAFAHPLNHPALDIAWHAVFCYKLPLSCLAYTQAIDE